MKKFSFNSNFSKQLSKCVFITAIWKYQHRHLSMSIVIGIGIDIGIAKKIIFVYIIPFLNRIFMFFLVLSYGIKTTFLHFVTYFSTIFYSSIQIRPLVFQKKGISTLGSIRPWRFEIPAYFAYFPVKHPGWSSF